MKDSKLLSRQKEQLYTICIIICCVMILPIVTYVDDIVVSDPGDAGPGTLRQAIIDAVDGDSIIFDMISSTISPTSGEYLITKSITIDGFKYNDTLQIDGSQDVGRNSRIFRIASGKTVTIKNIKFIDTGELARTSLFGGAILSSGTLSIQDCIFPSVMRT